MSAVESRPQLVARAIAAFREVEREQHTPPAIRERLAVARDLYENASDAVEVQSLIETARALADWRCFRRTSDAITRQLDEAIRRADRSPRVLGARLAS